MNALTRLRGVMTVTASAVAATALAASAAVALAGPASAATAQHRFFPGGARHAVFVQTDNTGGNQVVAYSRAPDGSLTLAGSYATGGLGGVLSGSVVDHLASQGSLGYDRRHDLVIAVNAGSNSVSVFAARGDRLKLRQVIGSGGAFPVSVAVHGDLVYVLNAENGGSVQGYRVIFGQLFRLPGSHRALGLDPTATPQFTNTPGQVAFSPDGSALIVTTKMNGNDIDVFGVRFGGRLSPKAVINSEPGTVPFGITFDQAGHLVVADAGPNALATYTLNPGGTVTLVDSLGNSQAATCWAVGASGFLFAGNAGSGTESRYSASASGSLTLLGETATDPGTVDAAASPSGHFLYVQTGANGIVDEFAVHSGGLLTEIGSVTVAGAVGGEGIVAA